MKTQVHTLVCVLLAFISATLCCQQPCLLVSNTTNILTVQAASLTNQQPVSVISNLSRAVALDVHINRNLIFWSDVINKNIKRANVDGSNIVTIVQDRTGVIDGLAVEWTTSLLYWTDTTFDNIEVAHLDGSRRKVLIKDNLDEPRGIAVDPQAGLIFWTDWGATPKIECAYLNGENRHAVVSSSLGWPNDITLDHSTQKMYWVDAKTHKIEYADYTGFNRGPLFHHPGIHPFGVDIYSSWLYWTDWATQSGLHQMDKSSGFLNSRAQVSGRRMGLVVMDSSKQPSFSNGCQSNNGGCSFLCLLKPNGYTCECENGTILGSDNKTCGAPVYCPQFVPKPNTVTVSSCKTSVGSHCSFKCRNGYSLSSGSAVVTCLSSGVWSSGGPSCKDSEPPVITSCPGNMFKYAGKDKKALFTWSPPNATDNSGMPPNVTISLGPSPPVRLVEGVNHVTYTAVDQAKNKAVCSFTITVKVINCTIPTPSGVLQKGRCENSYGGTCNFTCPYGYRMVGVATLNCLATNGGPPGVWDRQLPRCEAIVCPVPATPANAVKSNCNGQVSESVGTVCQFTCMNGFQPSAVQTRTCLANGTWSGTPLVCYSVACHPLIKPKFGSLTPSTCLNGGKYNDICYLTCRKGFSIKGTTTRTCGSNGRWTGLNDTQCEGTSACKRPGPPANGAIACHSNLVSMFCTVHCNPGYTFAFQPKMLFCGASDGKWMNQKKKPDIPDCSVKKPPQIGFDVKLYYLVKNCDEQNDAEVKDKFHKILKVLNMEYGYCQGQCRNGNIHVKCGKTDDKRRKRSVDKQETLEIDFQVKIPFPENTTSNINTTLKDVRTSVFEAMNSSASSLEVNGVRLTLAKAPSLRFVGL